MLRRYIGWFFGIFAMVMASVVMASPNNPQRNVDYQMLSTKQPTDTGRKVEIIEFFGYFCPHCHAFDSYMTNWARKHQKTVVLKRVIVKFNESMVVHQKMFHTLSLMGVLTNGIHRKIFDAVQLQGIELRSDEEVFDFIGTLGVDRKRFEELYNSFYVRVVGDKSMEMQSSYEVESVPMVVIDGRYQTSPAVVSSGNNMDVSESEVHKQTIKVIEHLVNRVLKEKSSKR